MNEIIIKLFTCFKKHKRMKKLMFLSFLIYNSLITFAQYDFGTLSYSNERPKFVGVPVQDIVNTNNELSNRYNANYNSFINFYTDIYRNLDSDKKSLRYRSQVYALNLFANRMKNYVDNGDWSSASYDLENAKNQYYIDLNNYPSYEEKQNEEILSKAKVKAKVFIDEGFEDLKENDISSAISNFNDALEIYPNIEGALYGRCLAYLNQNSFDLALSDLNTLIKYYADNKADRYILRASIYKKKGNNFMALSDYSRVLNDYSSVLNIERNAYIYSQRGWVYYYMQDYNKALEDFNQQVFLDGKNPIAYYNRGSAKDMLKDFSGSISDYKQAIIYKPDFSMAYNNIGWAKFEQKDYKGALTDLNKSIALDSTNYVAYDSRAETKFYLNDYKGCIKDCNKAISLKSTLSNSFFIRGRAKFKLNDKKGACEDWNQSSNLGKYEANDYMAKYCNSHNSSQTNNNTSLKPDNKYESIKNNNTLTDTRDGRIYKTIKIGTQIWMAENLAYKANIGCLAYNNDQSNVATYGYLYTWETAKNVCPDGWHLPSDAEWTKLTDYLESEKVAGVKLKVTSSNSPAWDGNNTSGFSALPAGYSVSGTSNGVGTDASFWTATEYNATRAWLRNLDTGDAQSNRDYYNKTLGFSVRCVKDK
jgi:uncharacterized protein (TIGR02145 family)